MQKRKYNVIFRTCDVVNAINNNPRPFDLTKADLIKVCFLSLLDALNGVEYKIIALGDKLTSGMIDFFKKFEVEIILGNYGNDQSIRETLKIANNIPDDEWIYFCEDDYLHLQNCFQKIDTLLNEQDKTFEYVNTKDSYVKKENKGKFYNFLRKSKRYFDNNFRNFNLTTYVNFSKKDLFIFLPDYPDRYLPKYRKHSLIFQTSDYYFRQVTDVTFSFVVKSSTVKKHFQFLNKTAHKANDTLLSTKLFGKYGFMAPALCVSPMPGFATHMHRDTLTKLINWEEISNLYLIKIKEMGY